MFHPSSQENWEEKRNLHAFFLNGSLLFKHSHFSIEGKKKKKKNSKKLDRFGFFLIYFFSLALFRWRKAHDLV